MFLQSLVVPLLKPFFYRNRELATVLLVAISLGEVGL